MSKRFLPVMRRTSLLDDATHSKFKQLVESRPDVLGVLVPIQLDEILAIPCFAPKFGVKTYNTLDFIPWRALQKHNEDDLLPADLGMHLMGSSEIRNNLQKTARHMPMKDRSGWANLIILPHSIIIAHDAPNYYLQELSDAGQIDLNEETQCARLCSMLLRPTQTAHEAISEAAMIAEDLDVFRTWSRPTQDRMQQLGFELGDPTTAELQAVQSI
jgi:hypothetical protein